MLSLKTTEEGGVRANNKFGVFYEEYPLASNSTHVLNGFIYSLYGLFDLGIWTAIYKQKNILKMVSQL